MTKAQRISHKKGNQLRKQRIMSITDPRTGKHNAPWFYDGVIQNGKHTP